MTKIKELNLKNFLKKKIEKNQINKTFMINARIIRNSIVRIMIIIKNNYINCMINKFQVEKTVLTLKKITIVNMQFLTKLSMKM